MSKPLLYSCEACHFSFELSLESLLRVFFTEPLVDHILATCTFCSKSMTIWNLNRTVVTNALSKNPEPALEVRIDEQAAQRLWTKYAKSKQTIEEFCAEMASRLDYEE